MSETSAQNPVNPLALNVAQLAKILSSAYNRRITEEQVRQVAEAGNLLRADDTISLLEYVAFLVQEANHAAE